MLIFELNQQEHKEAKHEKISSYCQAQAGKSIFYFDPKIYVEADNANNANNAKLIIEAQYGKGCISGSFTPA